MVFIKINVAVGVCILKKCMDGNHVKLDNSIYFLHSKVICQTCERQVGCSLHLSPLSDGPRYKKMPCICKRLFN